LFLTGIGSSYNAAAYLFYADVFPVRILDASELLHFATLPADSVITSFPPDGESMREEDLAITRDLRKLGPPSC
jgi:hypothetical protein